jgi:hypothetical protein
MRHSLAWIIVATTGAATTTACSLVANLGQFDNAKLASTDAAPTDGSASTSNDGAVMADAGTDSTVGSDDAASSDEASLSDDASASDAGSSGDDADGSALGDASMDASAHQVDSGDAGERDAEAGPTPTWCVANSPPSFVACIDFDEGRTYAQVEALDWSSAPYFEPYDFGSLDTTDYAPGSPPDCLLLTTPELDAGGVPAQEQFTQNTKFQTSVDVSFALKITNFDSTVTDLSLIRIAYTDSSWTASLDLNESNSQVLETIVPVDGGANTYVSHPVPLPPLNQWVNVDFRVDSAANTVTLSYGTVQALPTTGVLTHPQATPSMSVEIGVNYLQPSTASPLEPMEIRYDNVLVQ